MNALRMTLTLAMAAGLAAGTALAQSAAGSSGTEARGSAKTEAQSAAISGAARADADAKLRHEIEVNAVKVRVDERDRTDMQLDTDAREVDHSAVSQGEARVGGRIAEEFGTTLDAVVTEKVTLGASWGDLLIAHSIAANSKAGVTVESLLGMKRDGMGWGKIAAGLGLKLGSVVSAVHSEGRVAAGLVRASGHVAPMHGVGARGDVGAGAGLHVGVGQAHAGVGHVSGVGAGVKIRP